MRRQVADHDCGPTAVANALEALGRRVGLAGLRALTGCDPEGSDDEDVRRALLAYGCGVDEFASDDALAARAWLAQSLAVGSPTLLCVDRWGHWITALGALGDATVIYDPGRETGGATALRWKALRRRWEAARRVRRRAPRYYGVAVGAPLW